MISVTTSLSILHIYDDPIEEEKVHQRVHHYTLSTTQN